MRNRNILLVGALIVLIGIYWFVKKSQPVVETDRPFVTADSAKVDLLRIESPDETVELAKEGDKWWVTKPVRYPAAERNVGTALQKLHEMKKLSMITEKDERYNEFQVSDSGATKVTIGQGGKTVTFLVGKSGPSMQTTYARMANSKEVWEIAGNHAGTFKRKSKEWRDKTITDMDMTAINKVVMQYPLQAVTASLVDTTWKIDDGKQSFEADKSLVERVTRMISKISAVDFADTLGPSAFDKPEAHVVATLNTGETVDLKLIPKDADGNQYFLRKDGASSDFVIYKSTATALMKKADDFKVKPEDLKDKTGKAKAKA
jgi:hypothetical protein